MNKNERSKVRTKDEREAAELQSAAQKAEKWTLFLSMGPRGGGSPRMVKGN